MTQLLTVEYLHDHGLYIVIPVFSRKESEHEYMFSNFLDAKEFIDYFYKNPFAADVAYQIKERNRL